jgi:hypothetical protein
MLQRRREPRLAQEPVAEVVVLCELRREELQRHHPVEHHLVGQVDDTHPATAQNTLDPVAEQLAARAQIGRQPHG